jgi:nicotinate-nucleotide adenylyltransferase
VPNPAPRRLGLLGGTFDPPHLGHLAAARTVLTQLGLDHVDLLVANDPWQKTDERTVTSAGLRLQMAEALVAGEAGLGVDDREIRRGGPTYTADTLEELRRQQPETELFLIVGSDTAERITTWHRPEVVRSLSTLVIVNRGEQKAPQHLDGDVHVFMEPVEASSTSIRERIARSEPIDHLTVDGVLNIIQANGLYRSAS